MKKILYSAAALALAFFAGSCQQENLEPVVSGNTVTYTVQVADAVATRALGDDITAVNELVYEVYRTVDEGETDFTGVDNLLYHKTAKVENGVATIEIEFVNDQNFTVLFWAHVKGNDVYDVDDLTEVTITSPDVANNVNAQAFVGRDFVRDCVSDNNGKVTLVRPVSQLNIATTPESLVFEAEAGETGSTVLLEGSSVKVTGLATSYNIASLSAFGAAATKYTYTETAVPTDVLTVNGKNYTYVAMNYVGFAPEMGTSEVTVSYVINTTEGNIDNEILNVPVKPNYRTNIIGNLITSKTDYTIELDKTWGDPDLAPDPIYLAAAIGGEVTLTEDIVLTSPLEVKAKMTINLNGKTISGNYHKSVGAIIKNTGTLTITGGIISSTGENGGSAVQNNGTMTIEGVTLNGAPNANGSWPSYTVNNTGELTIIDSKITSYHGAVASYGEGAVVTLNDSEIDMAGIPGFTSHGIYTYENGKVIVDGGTYANKATDQAASGASVINGAVEVKAGNFSGRIENYYGTPVLKGGSFSVKPNNNFIAAGYKVIEKNGKYYVVSEETDGIVSDKADLQNALKAAVTNGETELVIDAEGASLNLNYGFSSSTVPAGSTVTIRNANIEGQSKDNYTNGTIIFEDCTFSNPNGAYSIHFDGGTGSLIFKNCDLIGWNSFGGSLESVSFENCTLTGNGIYALIRSYTDLTLKNCTIDASNANHTDAYSDGVQAISPAKLTMENVVYVVYNEESFKNALQVGSTNLYLKDGDYTFPQVNLQGKELTLVGSKDVVIDASAIDARNQFVTGATIKFDGVTLNFGKVNYMGFANTASLTYKNCDINGLQFLFGPQVVFEGCSLNSNGAEHSVWTYGAKNVTFTDCDFTYGDRAVNCYSDNDGGKQTVNFTDCTFATSNTASEGAVEINSCFFSVGIEVNMDGCTAPAYGQMAYVSPWDSTNGAKTTINIQ